MRLRPLRPPLRKSFGKFLLRGSVLRWWVRRKTRQVEHLYLSELVRASLNTSPKTEFPHLPRGRGLQRLLLIGDFLWESHELVPELRRFLDVTLFDLHPVLREPHASEQPAETVLNVVRGFLRQADLPEPDVILLYASAALLSEELFALLRQRWSCPLLGMNLDDKVNFLPQEIFTAHGGGYAPWGRHFDVNLTNSIAVSDWYRERGLPVVYFPPGYKRPSTPPPETSASYDFPLSFLGARKLDREKFVQQLAEAGVNVALFGSGWPGTEWIDDPVTVFRRSQMNLGIGFATERLTNLKNRDFECPGAGACYLTTYNWELAPLFEIGKEILLYRELPELVEIFSWHRRRPEVCAQIARAAYARCLRDHTWEQRFRQLFQTIGLSPR